jgi:hypothetical protein
VGCTAQAGYRTGALNVNNGPVAVGWRGSGFVISADMRYPASEAGYQPRWAHVPYRDTWFAWDATRFHTTMAKH